MKKLYMVIFGGMVRREEDKGHSPIKKRRAAIVRTGEIAGIFLLFPPKDPGP